MSAAELRKVERGNEALDCADRIICSHIVLNPRRKETGLLPALAGLERAIRHKPNRTSTPEKAEFLLSLDGQISGRARKPVHPFAQKYSALPVGQIISTNLRVPPR